MDHYAEFVAAKRGIAAARAPAVSTGAVPSGAAKEALVAAVATLLTAGARTGALRDDVPAADVVATLVGIFLTADDRAQAGRQLDLLLDGLRAGSPGTRPG